jgi:hypothetical protein
MTKVVMNRYAAGMPAMFGGKPTKLGGGGRFAMIEAGAKKAGAVNPGAVAAAVGRKRYGAKKMAAMAGVGRKRAKKSAY